MYRSDITMKDISAAKAILKSLKHIYECLSQPCIDSEEYKELRSQATLLLMKIPRLIPDQAEELQYVIGTKNFLITPKHTVYTGICYLESFIDEQKPRYLKTLMEDAEEFMDDGLYPISAYCIRTYVEQLMKEKISDPESDRKTLSKLLEEIKKKGILSEEYIKSMDDKKNRLNSIVHQDDRYKSNPPSKEEIRDLIRWARIIEEKLNE